MHKQRISALVMAALAAPTGASLAGIGHATSAQAASVSPTLKFSGQTADMRWGPVQAKISVKNKKITGVTIVVNPDTRRSQLIDDRAIPILKQETLQAQSANLDTVSGATMTSEAYIQSLQDAIQQAQAKKALK